MLIFDIVIMLLIPIVIIVCGYIFSRITIGVNHVAGYRTTMSMKNDETWKFANGMASRIWIVMGYILLGLSCVIFGILYFTDQDALDGAAFTMVIIQTLLIILSIIPVEKALKKNFDRDGNRRQI
jgi:uncharacterized membrane protein